MVANKRGKRFSYLIVVGSCAAGLSGGLIAGCGGAAAAGRSDRISVVAAENEYGNVASQIGGRYVSVLSVESNPDVDPHEYEASPAVAAAVAGAQLVIQNGVGYDAFMGKLEAASPDGARRVLEVQHLLGLPDNTSNPHLWYRPTTMVKVAARLVDDLTHLRPHDHAYFLRNSRRFVASLRPWWQALKVFGSAHRGVPVATTEPVADYMLQAAGARNLTPFALQAAVMNGVDPAPEDVTAQLSLLTDHRVKALLYNEQVTDSLTASFRAAARDAKVPTVAVYETMPRGLDYQSWMLDEVRVLTEAVTSGRSTAKL